MNRRQLLKAGLVATAGLLLPTSVLAKALEPQNRQQLRTTIRLDRYVRPMFTMSGINDNYPTRMATTIDFMDLKKGDVFLLMEPEGVKVQNTFVTNDDGIWKFRATGNPYMKDFGKGLVGTIESEPLSKEEMKYWTITTPVGIVANNSH